MRKLLFVFLLFVAAVMARAEQVMISEIMYHPVGEKPEYIEVWNVSTTPRDMAKWRFTGGIAFEFPDFNAGSAQASFLKALERIIISSADEATTRAHYTIPAGVRVFGPWSEIESLANEGEQITLEDKNGVRVSTVDYRDGGRWPRAADGTGHSLVIKNENRAVDDFRNWRASTFVGGTPGAGDTAPAPQSLRLSEAHYSGNNAIDWIEVQNIAGVGVSADGLFVASERTLANKVALTGTVAANGFASFDVQFPAAANGDVTLYLADATNNILATVELERRVGRDSMQAVYPVVPVTLPRWQHVSIEPEWYADPTATRDAANNPAISSAVVINEIMCDPPSEHPDGEYVELHNRGTDAVSLAGWKLRGGVDYDFPANAAIPPGGYVVVSGASAYIRDVYPGITVYGDWSGNLANKGELIRLVDNFGNLADEVDYLLGGDWPDVAAGAGSSLELLNPAMDNGRASAWRDSDESNKSAFQSYAITETFRQSRVMGVATDYKELHIHHANDGHVILRNIAVKLNNAGSNLLTNSNVMSTNGSSATGWLAQGTHGKSFIDPSGDFHLIADGHGDVRPNRAEIDATAMVANMSYTISFEARWVSGTPRMIVQTWDRSIGKAVRLPVPNNLGTPGAVNSVNLRLAPSPLPQVDSVLHSPAVPKPTDPVVVTARVTSATPLSAVEVLHRADSITATNPWVAAPMFDDGTNGDLVPNDGTYTATITAHQTNNRIVQFYVKATAQGGVAELPKNGVLQPGMWMVDSRNIPTTLRRQRIVISAYDRAALNTSPGGGATYGFKYPRLSNHYFPAVFIHNETDVYYMAEIHKSGSPWTRSDANTLDRAKWKLPDDRIFRERQKTTWDNDATGGNRHHNRIIRYHMYLCGFPGSNHEEFAHTMVNADGVIVRNDTEPTDTDLLNRAFDNGNEGQLMQVEDEWWFDDAWNRQNRDADWSYKGTHEPTRYHTEYNLRSREWEYDYSALTELFRRVTTAPEDELNRMLNRDQVMLVAAVRGYAGDWDSQTLNRGKNTYLYRPPNDSRWMYLHWDSDLAFQNTGEVVVGGFTGWGAYANKPYNRKILNYYLTLLLKSFTRGSARMTAWFDAEEAASSAYTIDRGFYTNWFNSREARIIQEINGAFGSGRGNSYTAPFAVSTASGGETTANTVDIAGTAPSTAFQIVVDEHPEAIFRWNNQTEWTLAGLILKTGLNSFTVRTIDHLGNSLGTATFSITKTDNAPPAMILTSNPASWNVALGEDLLLDASASVDPDGAPLTFAWAVEPTSGVTLSHPTASSARAFFSRPGLYNVTVTGTDTNAAAVPLTREVLVYNTADFSSMGDKELDPVWQALNIEERDNYSPSAWFSTQDEPGTLLVQVLDDSAKPPTFGSPTHPLITRALPPTSDFVLQTDLKLENRQTGTFFTGLVVDTMESGAPVRYLFGLESILTGTAFTVKRSTGGSFTNVASQSVPSGAAIVRVIRAGNELRFQRQVNDIWQAPVAAQALPDGTTALLGGIFVATTAAENVRVGFDYVVLADSSNATPVLSSLRITELMYGPARPSAEEMLALPGVTAGDFEFIEVTNVGATPLELGGARFDAGITFVFPPGFVLGPGERTVIVAEETAFRLRYGNGVTIAGEFAGSLDNAGEEVRLLDGNGVEALRFTYSPLWYPPTDANGYSLVNRNPTGSDSYSVPGTWAISGSIGGSPGSGESGFSQTFAGWRHDHFTAAEQIDPLIGATTANPDGDNGDNLAEYAFAKNPRLSGDPVTTELSTVIVDGVEYVAIRFDRPKQALDLTYGIEISTDLLNWVPSGFLAGVPEDLSNGIERATFAVTGLTQAHATYHIRPTALHATGARPGDALPFTTPNTNPLASDKTVHAPVEGVPTVVYSTSDTSDADGDARTIAVLQYAGAGSATSDGTSITFTNAGFTGAETIQVGVSDGYGGSAVATVTLSNEAPVANADGFAVGTGGGLLTVLANDSDPDGDSLSILSVAAGAGGTVTTDGATISYTPGSAFTGSEEISYVVADQRGGEASGMATVVADFAVTRTVAGTNEQVPGMNGASWGVFGVPSIFAGGTQAGWLGSIKLGNAGLNGIFSGEIGAPQLRLRSDEPARDAAGAILPQTRFKSFRQPVFGNDSFAFLAKITGGGISGGNDSGVWLGNGTGLRAIAREGESAPGTNGARFKAFTSVAMLGTENLFFTAKLQPQGGVVTPANDTGLWVGTALALREGQTIDTGNGSRTVRSFAVLSSVKGSAGHGRYDSAEECVDALITFTDGGSAIATIRADASVTFAASTGQTDDQGRTPVQFGMPSSPGGGQMPVAITTFAGGAFSKANNVAVFDFADKRIVAQKGTLAVETNAVFEKFQDPVAGLGSDGARITAFLATLQGASAAENTGLWADTAGATPSLKLIAREGSLAPDAAGTKFKAFQSISVLEGRGPMFTAKLSSAGSRVTGGNDQGLWVTDSAGALRLVLREGDPINGKVLRTFRLLESVPGSPGQRRSWTDGDPAATIIYLAYFTDGSSAILTRTIP